MSWKERPTTRSILCNGELIKRYRSQRGLTQQELASEAGFTQRLIAKAEAGQTVHPDTVEILAETLSSGEKQITPEDLVYFPKAIVRHVLESFAKHERQCVAHCHQFLSEKMTTSCPGDPSIIEFAGEYETIDGFDQFWGNFFSVMERTDKNCVLDSLQMFESENQVAVLTVERADHKAVPSHLGDNQTPLGIVFTFERGKLLRFEDHFDVRRVQQVILDARREAQASA